MLERYYVGASILVEQHFDKVRSLALCFVGLTWVHCKMVSLPCLDLVSYRKSLNSILPVLFSLSFAIILS